MLSPHPSPSPSQQIAAMLAEVRQMRQQADELQAALAELVRSSSPSSPIAAVQPQPTTPQGEAKNGIV